MVVKIPEDADLDPRFAPDFGVLDEYKEEIVGTALGFPLAGVGLTQAFRFVDRSELTSAQKAWAKIGITSILGFGGGLGLISVFKGARNKGIMESGVAAGVGAAAVAAGSIGLQVFQMARGAGILPRKTPQGQIVPPRPDQIVPLPEYDFR